MRQYRWLLFDADNTLFDFDAAEDFALTHTLLHHGLAPEEGVKARYRAVNGPLWAACDRGEITVGALVVERFARFLDGENLPGDPAEWNRFYLDRLADGAALLPGAEALCKKLARSYTLALVTNGVDYVQRRRLERSPLAPLFDGRVYISGELGCRKPEKEFFDKVLDDLGAAGQKGRALVVGDSLTSDIQGARNAGLDSVWLNRRHADPGPAAPTYTVEGFAELEELLLPSFFTPKVEF